MIIEIKNKEVRGVLYIKDSRELLRDPTILPNRELYNLDYWLSYDSEFLVDIIEMRGSIISMMQFRKFLSMNFPKLLDE